MVLQFLYSPLFTVYGRLGLALIHLFHHVDFDFSHTRNNIDDFPDATLDDAGNYCRNPDGEPNLWCYTTNSSSRWEYCDVPLCEGETCDKNITDQLK